MPSASRDLATNFSISQTIDALYTGGVVQVTSDAKLLFSTCTNVVRVIDVETGNCKFTLGAPEETSAVTCLRLSLDESQVVVSYSNLLIRQFSLNPDGASLIRSWKSQHRAPVLVLEFGRQQKTDVLVSGGADFVVKVWNIELQYCTHNLRGAKAVISCLRFYGEGTLLAASADGEIRIWDLDADPSNRCRATLTGHSSTVTSLMVWSGAIISSCRDQTVTIWDYGSGNKIKTVPVFEAIECMTRLFVKPDLENFESKENLNVYLSAGQDGVLKVWDLDIGRCRHEIKLGGESPVAVEQIVPCPSAGIYVCVTADQNIYFLDAFKLNVKKQFVGFNDEILDTCFVGSEQKSLAVAVNSGSLRLYDCNDLSCTLLHSHTDSVLSLDCAPWMPELFASGSKDNSVAIWHFNEQTHRAALCSVGTGHTSGVSALKFSKLKSKFLVTGSYDSTLKLWLLPGDIKQLQDGQLKSAATVIAHQKDVTCVDVSPNDQLVVSGSLDKTAQLWKVEISGDTGRLTPAGTISGNKRGVWDVCFSPSDQVVATAGGDCTVRIFALSDRSCVKTFQGHDAAVLRVGFLPSGQQLLSTDGGGLLKLWNIRANECTKTLDAHENKVWALSVARKGDRVVTGGGDARILVWNDVSESEKLEAEKQAAEQIEQDQQLNNLMQRKMYTDALKLALKVERPHNALKIVTELIVLDAENNSLLNSAIRALSDSEVYRLLKYVAEWNTNSRNSQVAQRVLFEVLHIYSPTQLLAIGNMSEVLQALLPYTKRHFDRLSSLRQQTTFLDYTWQRMRIADQP